MKHFYIKCIFLVFFFSFGIKAFAYDCEVDGIYYNLDKTALTASVTHHETSTIKYTGEITIPSNITYNDTTYIVTSIGYSAFKFCKSLTSIEIPNSIVSIGNSSFYGCSGLTSIKIPNSVTSIGNSSFYGCSGLTSIKIPSSVTSIGGNTLSFCSNLKSIVVDLDNTVYDSRDNCNAIIETVSNNLIIGCMNTVIPNSIVSIGNYSFYGCLGLMSIKIPNSITSIGNSTFQSCSGLTSIKIPNSVTRIGDAAFHGCSALTSIEIPNSVTSIGNYVFTDCYNLANIVLPNSIKRLGDRFFMSCYALASIDIPNSVTYIGEMAFENCKSLTSIKIPNSVVKIGENAFVRCDNLKSVEIPNSVTSIGDFAFYECNNLATVYSKIKDVYYVSSKVFLNCKLDTLYVPYGLTETYKSLWPCHLFNYILEPPTIPLQLSCNSKGLMKINGNIDFTNKIDVVNVLDDTENTFVFTPKDNCKVEQVCLNGLDVTLSIENNTLKAVIPAKSQMVVTFANESGDMNNDGIINISDVVLLVNMILGN